MQISLKWVDELVDLELINLEKLIEKLTLGGFEVEDILEIPIENQTQLALDISATANRSDSLSVQGISLEVATLLDQKPKIISYSREIDTWKQQINTKSIKIENNTNYSIFSAMVIKNLQDVTVPKWLKQKLVSSGVEPVNNLIDFQNYILLETGYPFAFYDYEKIRSELNQKDFNLSISNAKKNEKFLASNDLDYNLNESTLLVKANELPIGIAGITEHKDFSYSDATTSLLIEGSIFNAATIRQQSRNLGLRTDRSGRYEKSLKNIHLIESFYRLISLLRINNPNLICNFHTTLQVPEPEQNLIVLKYKTINEILGPIKEEHSDLTKNIEPELINKYLNQLNFEFSYNASDLNWIVQIPYSRSDDITREIDLVEEVGRLHGFNNFLTKLPQIKYLGKKDKSYQTRKKITTCLLNLGLTEFIHYSLVSNNDLLANTVKLINPLVADYSVLRTSLLPSLVNTVQENMKQGNNFVEGFEYGHTFLIAANNKFIEKECVSGIFGGVKTKTLWSESAKALTWFEAKGRIEQFLKQLNVKSFWKTNESTNPILHPYRSAELYLANGKKLGIFGQINPILANKANISTEHYLFEFDFEEIQNEIQTNQITIYKPYSSYPKITKDLSFVIPQNINFKKLKEVLYCNGTQFLSDIQLLDEYRGSSIPDGHTSLCLQLTFQSTKQTLQNKQIEIILNQLETLLSEKFGANIRN